MSNISKYEIINIFLELAVQRFGWGGGGGKIFLFKYVCIYIIYINIFLEFPECMGCLSYFVNHTSYSCLCRKKFLKIKVDQIVQVRLNGLAILSIEKELVEKLDYVNLINTFEFKNTKRVIFK